MAEDDEKEKKKVDAIEKMIDIAVLQLLEEESKKEKEREKESNIIVAVYCTVCFLVVFTAILIGIFSGGLL